MTTNIRVVKKAGLKASALIIMRKMQDFNIIDEAFKESYPDQEEAVIDKHAFDININPASLVGAITGAAIAEKKTRAEILRKQLENDNSQVIQGNYYSQVQNIINRLKIIFTPFGVVYVVKNGVKEITIETIETEEMNSSMYAAWQSKDYNYYKTLLLNKMLSEIQLVEQEFAKDLIKKQMEMQSKITKKSSEYAFIDEDLTLKETLEYSATIKDFYSKNTDITEKMASILMDMVGDTEYRIEWGFDRPIEKYSGLAENLSFLGLSGNSSDTRSLQGKYLNPTYLSNRVKIGFLPDRILFIVDNKVMSTLLAINMNQESFSHFENQDSKYFEKYFESQAKVGISRMNGKTEPPKHLISSIVNKTASSNISDIFTRNDIHPGIYYLVLNKKYGFKWMNFDPDALVVIIEKDFGLKEGISDIPLNKILSIQACNVSKMPYESRHAFEKIIRSFDNKPIDFFKRETEDMDEDDIAFGIDIMDRVTPYDDIYDNFSQDIFSYIIQLFVRKDLRIYWPSKITGSEKEPEFYKHLNDALLKATNDADIVRIENDEEELKAIVNNGRVSTLATSVLDSLRLQMSKIQGIDNDKFVDILTGKLNVEPVELRGVIKDQVLRNIRLDEMLMLRENLFKEQINLFGLN